ncbi:MAG TPA: N-methyl-L-tryptophan oxidase, partial [Aggregatilineales bacterium]|nr:N-methyl-L-tryptophan oxidase [Aggregatilineales bacterium]
RMGSSYGESRIIRYAYDHPTYVEMAKLAFGMWHDLEHEAGCDLMIRTGGLDFGDPDWPSLSAFHQTLESARIPFDWLSPQEVARRFPQFKLPPHMRAIFQADAAALYASRCVVTQAALAQKHSADLRFNTPITGIEPLRESVRVHTADGQYEAGSLVITAGPWAGKVLANLDLKLPLQPTREEVVLFHPQDAAAFKPDRFPIFISHGAPWHYGLPDLDGTGLKVAVHRREEPTDPDSVRRTPDADYIAHIRSFVRAYIPRGDGQVGEARVCLYTMTPDEHFIIDRHPAYPHIVFGAGFSGHGFKFGPLIGSILCDLATIGTTPHDISLFSARRFLK